MSIFKNILTLGSYGKLQDEISYLESKASMLRSFSSHFSPMVESQKKCFKLLNEERKEAQKNLFLAKTLVFKIKKRAVESSLEIPVEYAIDIPEFNDQSNMSENLHGEVSFDIGAIGDEMIFSASDSLDYLASKDKLTELDVKTEAIGVGIDILLSSIESLVSLNSQVREQRQKVQYNIEIVKENLILIKDTFPMIYYETNRAIEIFAALNKNNQVFSEKYQELLSLIFDKPGYMLFYEELTNKKLQISEEQQKGIMVLLKICSEYGKISKLKVRG